MAVTPVTMPQLGESVTEGTISKWLKKPGDKVEKYESIAEVITDKVNAEIPSPVAGVIKELKVEEGATVPVGTEIMTIDMEGAVVEAPAAAAPQPAAPTPAPSATAAVAAPAPTAPGTEDGRAAAAPTTPTPTPAPTDMAGAVAAAMPQAPAETYAGRPTPEAEQVAGPSEAVESEEELLRRRSTPAVRRLAEEYGVDLRQV